MFWFVLARDLGMSVARAQSEISSYEFSEWQAMYRTTYHPDDRRAAVICSLLARIGGSKTARPENFLPSIKKPAQTIAQMKAALMRALPSKNEPRLR